MNTVHVHAKMLQSCPTLCNPMDCSPPGSSVYGILQAYTTMLKDQICILSIAAWFQLLKEKGRSEEGKKKRGKGGMEKKRREGVREERRKKEGQREERGKEEKERNRYEGREGEKVKNKTKKRRKMTHEGKSRTHLIRFSLCYL